MCFHFVNTEMGSDAIINIVNPPNTLFNFCYTP